MSITNTERIQANNADLLECIEIAENLPEAGGGGGGNAQYAKIVATPEATASFTIANPLGGLAHVVLVRRTADTLLENSKIQTYVASRFLKLGAAESSSASGTTRNAVIGVESGLGNGEFMFADGAIELRQVNAARTWDTESEYEVEIWQ